MMDYEIDVAQTETIDAQYIPANKLKVGDKILIADKICTIVNTVQVKNGKHGGAKCIFKGLCLFEEGKVKEMTVASTHNVTVPIVKRTDYTVIFARDGYCNLLSASGETRDDVTLTPDMEAEVREIMERDEEAVVTILSSGENMKVQSVRSRKNE